MFAVHHDAKIATMLRHGATCFVFVAAMLYAACASAQQRTYTYNGQRPTSATAPATTNPGDKKLSEAEISAIVAPIALYPDPLISQIFMASTYPLEVVQADRWVKANKSLKDKALTDALEAQDWDASVKSLVNFPDVLSAMNEKLDLTIKLGDAFIAQQADVMNAVQALRAKAQAAGNLKSNEQQKVTMEAAPTTTVTQAQQTVVVEQPPAQTQIIKIEPTNPQTIYVPSYSPTVVYGGWPYPAYPPYYYYPPAPSYGSNLVSFGLGVAAGAAWGYAWGNCDWGGNDVDIDVDRNTNINNNIDRSKYRNEINNRQTNRGGERGAGGQGGRSSFQHNPAHRGGVPYRDSASAQRFGGANQQAAAARESYRGRADAGRSELSRGAGAGTANRTGAGLNSVGGSRSGSYAGGTGGAGGARSAGSSSYGSGGGTRSGSFDGVSGGGSAARASSSRGQSSRSSANYSRSAPARSAPARSAPARSSGGASRGGGARGGGRGGGRR
jgi:hypothetical protein